MYTRQDPMRNIARLTTMIGILLATATFAYLALAEEPEEAAIATPLLSLEIPDISGKEVVMMTVQYPPGGASPLHRHNAHVFVYVLEGALRTQVAGHEPVTLKAGQTFYENPGDIHVVSANASATTPVKFLVFWLKNVGQPL